MRTDIRIDSPSPILQVDLLSLYRLCHTRLPVEHDLAAYRYC